MDSTDYSALIDGCRTGDPLAWEGFVRQFQGRLFALAYGYVGEREEARDLAQEIFVRLYETRAQWAPADEFLPWLFRVARNRSVDYLRRKKVRTPGIAVDESEVAELPDPSPSAEALAVDAHRRGLLHAALLRLSAVNREIVVLRDVHGLSIQQVAAVLGVPLGTVKSRASRARAELTERVMELARGQGDA